MFSLTKKIFAVVAITLASAAAYAWIPEGFWTDGRSYYYINSQYHYCTSDYKPEAQRLSYSQSQELRSYTYDGQCEGWSKGPKNYQGRSYYFNGQGAFCEYRYYKNNLQELSSQQAQQLFQNRFDGWCVE